MSRRTIHIGCGVFSSSTGSPIFQAANRVYLNGNGWGKVKVKPLAIAGDTPPPGLIPWQRFFPKLKRSDPA